MKSGRIYRVVFFKAVSRIILEWTSPARTIFLANPYMELTCSLYPNRGLLRSHTLR
jgi:hypothetical protein